MAAAWFVAGLLAGDGERFGFQQSQIAVLDPETQSLRSDRLRFDEDAPVLAVRLAEESSDADVAGLGCERLDLRAASARHQQELVAQHELIPEELPVVFDSCSGVERQKVERAPVPELIQAHDDRKRLAVNVAVDRRGGDRVDLQGGRFRRAAGERESGGQDPDAARPCEKNVREPPAEGRDERRDGRHDDAEYRRDGDGRHLKTVLEQEVSG